MGIVLFYNLEFIYTDPYTGTDKPFTVYNLTGHRAKEIRETAFKCGLFVGVLPENKEQIKTPMNVGVIIPPHAIKLINLFLVVGSDDKEKK